MKKINIWILMMCCCMQMHAQIYKAYLNNKSIYIPSVLLMVDDNLGTFREGSYVDPTFILRDTLHQKIDYIKVDYQADVVSLRFDSSAKLDSLLHVPPHTELVMQLDYTVLKQTIRSIDEDGERQIEDRDTAFTYHITLPSDFIKQITNKAVENDLYFVLKIYNGKSMYSQDQYGDFEGYFYKMSLNGRVIYSRNYRPLLSETVSPYTDWSY